MGRRSRGEIGARTRNTLPVPQFGNEAVHEPLALREIAITKAKEVTKSFCGKLRIDGGTHRLSFYVSCLVLCDFEIRGGFVMLRRKPP
jgi:hypothetical protein